MKFKPCYRIVEDCFAGYEVQIKRWWFPFWVQKWEYFNINSFNTVDDAKEWIEKGCPKNIGKEEKKKKTVWISEGCQP